MRLSHNRRNIFRPFGLQQHPTEEVCGDRFLSLHESQVMRLHGIQTKIRSLNNYLEKKQKELTISFVCMKNKTIEEMQWQDQSRSDGDAHARYANYLWHKRAYVFMRYALLIYTSATTVEPDGRKGYLFDYTGMIFFFLSLFLYKRGA